MANIKGLTIEIGGDVTPLQQALKSVDDTSKKLRSELAEVEKGLKFDPTNTELLAQKQLLLAQSIENTNERLATLRETERQMQAAGTADPMSESYRKLQREIANTESWAKKNSDALAGMSEKTAEAGEAADGAGQKMGGLSGAVNGIADMFGIKLPPQLSSAVKQFDATGEAGGNLGDKINGLAQQMGVNLPPQVSKAISSLGGVTGAAIAAAAAAALVVKALADMAKEGAAAADEIATNASIMGVANETYQEFAAIADLIDVSADTIGGSMSKLTRSMNDARQGTEKTGKAFSRLGVDYKDNAGNLRDSEDVFYEVVDALGAMENQTERDALAMEILGKSARELNPLIEAGSAKMRNYNQYAREHGAIMTDEVLDAYLGLADAMDWAKQISDGLRQNLGSIITPGMTATIETLNSIIGQISKRIQESQLTETLKSVFSIVGTIISLLGTALKPVIDVIFDTLDQIFAVVNLILAPLEFMIKSAVNLVKLLMGEMNWKEFGDAAEESFNKMTTSFGKSMDTLLGKSKDTSQAIKNENKNTADSIASGFEEGADRAGEASENTLMTYREAVNKLKEVRKEERLDAQRHYKIMQDEYGRSYIQDQRLLAAQQAKEMESAGAEIGEKTAEGISRGLRTGRPKIEEGVRSTVDTIKRLFEQGLDIHSPSRVARGWGMNISAGLAQGMESQLSSVKTAIRHMLDAVGALGSSQGAGSLAYAAGGNTTIQMNVQAANLHEMQDVIDIAKRARQTQRSR